MLLVNVVNSLEKKQDTLDYYLREFLLFCFAYKKK